LIHRLVIENLKHRPVLTLLTVIFIGVQVCMILTLVGVSRGVLGDMAARSKGTGADILVRPPDSSAIGFTGAMKEKIVDVVRKVPHVALATGTYVQAISTFDSITGVHLDEFNALSGGLNYLAGHPFQGPDDLVVDEVFARAHKLKPGDTVELGHLWHVTGIVEQGKLSRTFADIRNLQEMFSAQGMVSVIWVKLDNAANTQAAIASLKQLLPDYKIYSAEEFVSLFSVDNVPILKRFTQVIIALTVIGGFFIVLLAMYMTVLARTREIGILKALGASPGYVMGILFRETVVLALLGTVAGIIMAYGTRQLMAVFVPNMPQVIVPDWYPYATLIALGGSLIGAIYPGLRAAQQDAIQALAYD
jgi:putative ABC transport system permease protein